MITILKEENKDKIKTFLSSQGISYNMNNSIVMTAKNGEQILGLGALSIKDYQIYLDHILMSDEYTNDFTLATGLAKSLLNLADLRGIKIVYGQNPELTKLYEALRFKLDEENPERYILSLEGYFTCENN